MVRAMYVNNRGEVEVDPFDNRGQFERWHANVTAGGAVDYGAMSGISAPHSAAIVRFTLDMAAGKNTARGHRRGPRSYTHLVHTKQHLRGVFLIIESRTGKKNMDVTEDEILSVFLNMRKGIIRRRDGRAYIDVRSYAKIFCAFWRWHMRTQLQQGIVVPDIVSNIDTNSDHKPSWVHFTLQDVERMTEHTTLTEYKALVYFLFDSGIRAPKELQNVRVMDLTDVPGASQLFLTIREETSKTFGRKIKLMLSSDIIRRYIREKKLQPNDFLFTNDATTYNRSVARLGYKALGIGSPRYDLDEKGYHKKLCVRRGITMYDFRHNSVCYYLPIYKSENQLKYRYGWKKADMIHYYSEYIGMRDTIKDEDMLTESTQVSAQRELIEERRKVALLAEELTAQKAELDERMKKLEATMLQQFADNFTA